MIYLKIVRREVTPSNKAHVGGLVEEEREGPEKGARGRGRDQSPGDKSGGGGGVGQREGGGQGLLFKKGTSNVARRCS